MDPSANHSFSAALEAADGSELAAHRAIVVLSWTLGGEDLFKSRRAYTDPFFRAPPSVSCTLDAATGVPHRATQLRRPLTAGGLREARKERAPRQLACARAWIVSRTDLSIRVLSLFGELFFSIVTPGKDHNSGAGWSYCGL